MTLRASTLAVKVIGTLAPRNVAQTSTLAVKVIATPPRTPGRSVAAVSTMAVKVIGSAPATLTYDGAVSTLAVKVIASAPPPALVKPLDVRETPALDPNWAEPIRFTQAWKTAIAPAELTRTEDRHGHFSRPKLGIAAYFSGLDEKESGYLLRQALLSAQNRTAQPIWKDGTWLDQTLSSGNTTVFCDTTKRRFFKGMRVAFWQPGEAFLTFATVAEVPGPGQLELAQGLATDRPADSQLWPCFDAEMRVRQDFEATTGAMFQGSIEALEVAGKNTLLTTAGLAGLTILQHNNIDIFPFELDWGRPPSQGITAGSVDVVGRGTSPRVRPTVDTLAATHESCTRDEAWTLEQFFDRQQGSAKSFWVSLGNTMPFDVIVHVGTLIRIQELEDLEASRLQLKALAFRLDDNTIRVAEVLSIDDIGGGIWAIRIDQFDANLVSRIVAYSQAARVRFARDELVSEWTNTENASFDLVVQGVHRDGETREMRRVPVRR